MENGLVTGDGTKVLTVEEYDKFIQAIPESKRAVFEINTITGLRYVELQKLYDNPVRYFQHRELVLKTGFQRLKYILGKGTIR